MLNADRRLHEDDEIEHVDNEHDALDDDQLSKDLYA